MNKNIPRTPFATPLSGSARETETRIRSILSGPKKRPPALFLALIFAACLLCGNLVSCQSARAELPPPDLSLAPVDWEQLPQLAPLYTREENGNISIGGLENAYAEWNRPASGSFLYFAGDPAFCCPSLAGRSAEGSARWQDGSQDVLSVSIAINDSRLEDGTADGYSLRFTVDWSNRTVLESDFSSEVGDGTLELPEREMVYASRTLASLMLEAEWTATAEVTVLPQHPDLNRNGTPEQLQLVELEGGLRLEVLENGTVLYAREGYYAHVGWNAVFLCTLEGEDYLLQYNPTMYQGMANYSYALFTLEGDTQHMVRENALDFDINFGMPTPDGGTVDPDDIFDPDAIAGYMEEVNQLLSHSVQLLNTDGDLTGTFEKEGRLEDTLWFLHVWEPVFTRDAEKSLRENLRNFRDAMVRQASQP